MVLRDDIWEKVFESVGQSFGDKLVGNVAKANGSKFSHFLWVACFWDEGNISFINFIHGQIVVEDIQDHISNAISYNIPIFLVKNSGHTVKSESFGRMNLLESCSHFLSSKSKR